MTRWLHRLLDRLLGYVPVGSWRLYPLDEPHRRRFSLPERVPVPPEEWRCWSRGNRPERLRFEQIAAFASRFLAEHGPHRLVPSLERFVARAPRMQEVERALHDKEWAAAEPVLEQILTEDPADGRAHFLLGLVLLGQEQPEAAQDHLERAAPQMGEDPDYHVAIGRFRELQGDAQAAAASYRRALELREGHPPALERLAALGELVEIYFGDIDQPEKAYLTREAHEELIIKGWEEERRSSAFYVERSAFHLQNAQPNLALAAAERAVAEADPSSSAERTTALAALCRAHLALEQFDQGDRSIAELEGTAADSVAALSARAHWYWFQGRREDAAPLIERAIAGDPDRLENLRIFLDPEFPRARGGSLEALRTLLKQYPQSWAVQSLRASVLMASERWEEAVEAAMAAAEGGASEEALVELTGRLGRARRHAEVWQLAERAGGWRRFLRGHALLRSNLATSFALAGHDAAARELWLSLRDDDRVHPEVRLRARAELERQSAAGGTR